MRKFHIATMCAGSLIFGVMNAKAADTANAIGVDAYSMGAFIVEVKAGSAAEAAGLKPGDFVYYFDGKGVTSAAVLFDLVRATPPGKAVEIYLIRGGEQIAVNLTVDTVPGQVPPQSIPKSETR